MLSENQRSSAVRTQMHMPPSTRVPHRRICSWLHYSSVSVACWALDCIVGNPCVAAEPASDTCYDGPPFAWNGDRRALLRADLDAFHACASGLDCNELRYILDPADVKGPNYPSETFRVLKKNEEARFGEYRTRRLVLEAWDRMEASGEFKAMGCDSC